MTVVALDVDGEVIGFAHALSDGVTIYLAVLLVAPRAPPGDGLASSRSAITTASLHVDWSSCRSVLP